MKLYTVFIGLPFTLAFGHIYAETSINFEGAKRKVIIVLSVLVSGFLFLMWKSTFLSVELCAEIFFIMLGTILIYKFLDRWKEKKGLEEFNSYELLVICPQMFWGLIICILPFAHIFEYHAEKVCNMNELNLSRALYLWLGFLYIFYNRLFLCLLYKVYKRLRTI